MLLYLMLSGSSTIWDRDEGLYARYAVEMVESGNYLYATYNRPPGDTGFNHVMADKPPMLYWLMSVPIRIFGPTELACRVFGLLSTAVVCMLIYGIGRRLFDHQAGIMAMAMYGLSLLPAMLGTAALCDPVLMAFSMGVMLLAAKAVADGELGSPNAEYHVWGPLRLWHLLAMAACFGGAMLSKSAFGVLPLVAAVGIVIQNRLSGRPAKVGMKFLLACVLAAVLGGLIFLAWFVPADQATGGLFVRTHLGKHILGRATSPMEHHGGGGAMYFALLPLYLVIIFIGFFPWTLFIPGAISAALGGRLGGLRGKVFLIGWFVPVFVLVSLVATKLPHYIIFCIPALALAAAGVMRAEKLGQLNERDRKWLRSGRWFFAPVAFFLAAFGLLFPTLFPPLARWLLSPKAMAAVQPWLPAVKDLAPVGAVIGAISLVMGIVGLREHARGRYGRCAAVLTGGLAAIFISVALLLAPVFEKYKPAPEIGRIVRANVPAGEGFIALNYQEPSLVFYARRPILRLPLPDCLPSIIVDWSRLRGEIDLERLPISLKMNTGFMAFVQWLQDPKPGVLVASRAEIEQIEGITGPLGLREIGSRRGLNYSKGRWVELVVLKKGARD